MATTAEATAIMCHFSFVTFNSPAPKKLYGIRREDSVEKLLAMIENVDSVCILSTHVKSQVKWQYVVV